MSMNIITSQQSKPKSPSILCTASSHCTMKLLFICTPEEGHINPLLTTAAQIANEGKHHVTFSSLEHKRQRVEASGLAFMPAGAFTAEQCEQNTALNRHVTRSITCITDSTVTKSTSIMCQPYDAGCSGSVDCRHSMNGVHKRHHSLML